MFDDHFFARHRHRTFGQVMEVIIGKNSGVNPTASATTVCPPLGNRPVAGHTSVPSSKLKLATGNWKLRSAWSPRSGTSQTRTPATAHPGSSHPHPAPASMSQRRAGGTSPISAPSTSRLSEVSTDRAGGRVQEADRSCDLAGQGSAAKYPATGGAPGAAGSATWGNAVAPGHGPRRPKLRTSRYL